jgi:2-(3-amino-3-carboxypropyl)histidine synthase|tara:strand:- start:11221 stop:12228 length:1008 start_codon:yes stop_codon:yes gene_type:complete
MYELKDKIIIEEIKNKKARRILIQLPEGLKKEANKIVKYIEENTEAKTFISGESCWGGCDLSLEEAKFLNVDLIIHFGHAPFFKPNFPVVYVESRYNTDITKLVESSLKNLGSYNKVGLVASVQHIHQLEKIKEILEKNNKEAIIPDKKGRAFYKGHILGCEYTGSKLIQEKVDCFLVLGNKFHSLGLALSVDKKVILIDPINEEIHDLDFEKKKVTLKRLELIEKARNAHTFGIIVSMKSGQQNFSVAENIKKKLEEDEKEAFILTMNNITNDQLVNFYNIDLFVNTSCPRISIEDTYQFDKPIINYTELLIALDELKFDQEKNSIIIAPYGVE